MKTLTLITLIFLTISSYAVAQEGQTNQQVTQSDASFPGGQKAMDQYVYDHMQYPEESIEKGEEDAISIMLTVNADGTISNVMSISKNFPLLSAEAVRIVQGMPNWEPATLNGKPIKQQVLTMINFVLTH